MWLLSQPFYLNVPKFDGATGVMTSVVSDVAPASTLDVTHGVLLGVTLYVSVGIAVGVASELAPNWYH